MDKLLKFTTRNAITANWLVLNPNARIECWNCNKLIPQTDPKQKYCNRSCAKKYYRRLNKPIYDKECVMCEKDFTAFRSDKIYCEINCAHAAYRLRKGVPQIGKFKRECRECKNPFIVSFPVQFYCNFEHFYKHRLRHKHDDRGEQKNHYLTEDDLLTWNQMREHFWFDL